MSMRSLSYVLRSDSKREVAMSNTPVLWADTEVEKSGSSCACETHIQLEPLPKVPQKVPRPTEARLGEALLEGHRIKPASRLTDVVCTMLFHAAVLAAVFLRSEEHTSELQSHVNLVCRLLL